MRRRRRCAAAASAATATSRPPGASSATAVGTSYAAPATTTAASRSTSSRRPAHRQQGEADEPARRRRAATRSPVRTPASEHSTAARSWSDTRTSSARLRAWHHPTPPIGGRLCAGARSRRPRAAARRGWGRSVARDGVDRVLDVGAWARSRSAETPAGPRRPGRVLGRHAGAGHRPGAVGPGGRHRLGPAGRGGASPRRCAPQLAARLPGVPRPRRARRGPPRHARCRRRGTASPSTTRATGAPIVGPGDVVAWPSYTEKMDFECEVAAVVGRGGRDVAAADAGAHVFGYTIMNDWSARDVQKDEMSCWLGPAKAKDFATTLGPWLVTPDEWSPEDDAPRWRCSSTARCGRPARPPAGGGPSREMLAWVSRDEDLWPTDVLGSGTFGGGCGLDLDRWLPAVVRGGAAGRRARARWSTAWSGGTDLGAQPRRSVQGCGTAARTAALVVARGARRPAPLQVGRRPSGRCR